MVRRGRGGRGKKKKDEDDFEYDEDDDSDDGGKKKGKGRGKSKGKGKGKAVPKLKIKLGGRKKKGGSDSEEEEKTKGDSDEEFENMLAEAEDAMGAEDVQVVAEARKEKKGKLKSSLEIRTGRRGRRRKTLPMMSLSTRSSVRSVSKEERSSSVTPVLVPTISAVSILSWTKLPKESGAALLVRRMGPPWWRKTRMMSTWRCVGLARKEENSSAVTHVHLVTICAALTPLWMRFLTTSGPVQGVPVNHCLGRWRRF
eukprot:TRINITY_DN12538_c0_g1_i1.p1 TRINITY_DN12538_c0_g1~~TRINITY_DN12538_c0_g1_i1.p1  ORF type:complete len:256 (-),score=84.33 TRINITY_DN12538_c0_g1_i1:371-1138(-)